MLDIIKNNKAHFVYALLICTLTFQLVKSLGGQRGLEDKVHILQNIACNIPQDDFETQIHSLTIPSKMKKDFGDKHPVIWSAIKEKMVEECYG